jgi:hypothetical protein
VADDNVRHVILRADFAQAAHVVASIRAANRQERLSRGAQFIRERQSNSFPAVIDRKDTARSPFRFRFRRFRPNIGTRRTCHALFIIRDARRRSEMSKPYHSFVSARSLGSLASFQNPDTFSHRKFLLAHHASTRVHFSLPASPRIGWRRHLCLARRAQRI